MPGPPFAFGAILVILALIVALFIPDNPHTVVKSPTSRRVISPLSRDNELLAEQGQYNFRVGLFDICRTIHRARNVFFDVARDRNASLRCRFEPVKHFCPIIAPIKQLNYRNSMAIRTGFCHSSIWRNGRCFEAYVLFYLN
jgi:hypothetical protein